MPDETMTDETTTEETLQEGPEVETEETDAPEPTERSPMADMFEKTFEGVKYESLEPEQREAMYQYLLRTQATQSDPSRETPEPETLASENMDRFATMSVAEIDAAIAKAEDGGDFGALRDVLSTVVGTVRELPGWFNKAIGQLDDTVGDLKTDREMTAAMRKVPDATDADAEVARQMYKNGEAGSLAAGLKLALYERGQAHPKRDADSGAHRRRRAVAADQAAKGGDPSGRPMVSWPTTPEEIADLMRRDAEDNRLIKD